MTKIRKIIIGLFLSYAGLYISWAGVPPMIYIPIEYIGIYSLVKIAFDTILACLSESETNNK